MSQSSSKGSPAHPNEHGATEVRIAQAQTVDPFDVLRQGPLAPLYERQPSQPVSTPTFEPLGNPFHMRSGTHPLPINPNAPVYGDEFLKRAVVKPAQDAFGMLVSVTGTPQQWKEAASQLRDALSGKPLTAEQLGRAQDSYITREKVDASQAAIVGTGKAVAGIFADFAKDPQAEWNKRADIIAKTDPALGRTLRKIGDGKPLNAKDYEILAGEVAGQFLPDLVVDGAVRAGGRRVPSPGRGTDVDAPAPGGKRPPSGDAQTINYRPDPKNPGSYVPDIPETPRTRLPAAEQAGLMTRALSVEGPLAGHLSREITQWSARTGGKIEHLYASPGVLYGNTRDGAGLLGEAVMDAAKIPAGQRQAAHAILANVRDNMQDKSGRALADMYETLLPGKSNHAEFKKQVANYDKALDKAAAAELRQTPAGRQTLPAQEQAALLVKDYQVEGKLAPYLKREIVDWAQGRPKNAIENLASSGTELFGDGTVTAKRKRMNGVAGEALADLVSTPANRKAVESVISDVRAEAAQSGLKGRDLMAVFEDIATPGTQNRKNFDKRVGERQVELEQQRRETPEGRQTLPAKEQAALLTRDYGVEGRLAPYLEREIVEWAQGRKKNAIENLGSSGTEMFGDGTVTAQRKRMNGVAGEALADAVATPANRKAVDSVINDIRYESATAGEKAPALMAKFEAIATPGTEARLAFDKRVAERQLELETPRAPTPEMRQNLPVKQQAEHLLADFRVKGPLADKLQVEIESWAQGRPKNAVENLRSDSAAMFGNGGGQHPAGLMGQALIGAVAQPGNRDAVAAVVRDLRLEAAQYNTSSGALAEQFGRIATPGTPERQTFDARVAARQTELVAATHDNQKLLNPAPDNAPDVGVRIHNQNTGSVSISAPANSSIGVDVRNATIDGSILTAIGRDNTQVSGMVPNAGNGARDRNGNLQQSENPGIGIVLNLPGTSGRHGADIRVDNSLVTGSIQNIVGNNNSVFEVGNRVDRRSVEQTIIGGDGNVQTVNLRPDTSAESVKQTIRDANGSTQQVGDAVPKAGSGGGDGSQVALDRVQAAHGTRVGSIDQRIEGTGAEATQVALQNVAADGQITIGDIKQVQQATPGRTGTARADHAPESAPLNGQSMPIHPDFHTGHHLTGKGSGQYTTISGHGVLERDAASSAAAIERRSFTVPENVSVYYMPLPGGVVADELGQLADLGRDLTGVPLQKVASGAQADDLLILPGGGTININGVPITVENPEGVRLSQIIKDNRLEGNIVVAACRHQQLDPNSPNLEPWVDTWARLPSTHRELLLADPAPQVPLDPTRFNAMHGLTGEGDGRYTPVIANSILQGFDQFSGYYIEQKRFVVPEGVSVHFPTLEGGQIIDKLAEHIDVRGNLTGIPLQNFKQGDIALDPMVFPNDTPTNPRAITPTGENGMRLSELIEQSGTKGPIVLSAGLYAQQQIGSNIRFDLPENYKDTNYHFPGGGYIRGVGQFNYFDEPVTPKYPSAAGDGRSVPGRSTTSPAGEDSAFIEGRGSLPKKGATLQGLDATRGNLPLEAQAQGESATREIRPKNPDAYLDGQSVAYTPRFNNQHGLSGEGSGKYTTISGHGILEATREHALIGSSVQKMTMVVPEGVNLYYMGLPGGTITERLGQIADVGADLRKYPLLKLGAGDTAPDLLITPDFGTITILGKPITVDNPQGVRLSQLIRDHDLTGNIVISACLSQHIKAGDGVKEKWQGIQFDVPEAYPGGTRSLDPDAGQASAQRTTATGGSNPDRKAQDAQGSASSPPASPAPAQPLLNPAAPGGPDVSFSTQGWGARIPAISIVAPEGAAIGLNLKRDPSDQLQVNGSLVVVNEQLNLQRTPQKTAPPENDRFTLAPQPGGGPATVQIDGSVVLVNGQVTYPDGRRLPDALSGPNPPGAGQNTLLQSAPAEIGIVLHHPVPARDTTVDIDLRNAQFGGGLINANTVNVGTIGKSPDAPRSLRERDLLTEPEPEGDGHLTGQSVAYTPRFSTQHGLTGESSGKYTTISGHGVLETDHEIGKIGSRIQRDTFVVPEGVNLHFLGLPGGTISDRLGQRADVGGDLTGVPLLKLGAGDTAPDILITPDFGTIKILGNPIKVDNPQGVRLSQLIRDHDLSGNIVVSSCLQQSVSQGRREHWQGISFDLPDRYPVPDPPDLSHLPPRLPIDPNFHSKHGLTNAGDGRYTAIGGNAGLSGTHPETGRPFAEKSFTVPDGVTVYFPSLPGGSVHNRLAEAIEKGEDLGRIPLLKAGAGATSPDPLLLPGRYEVAGNYVRIVNPEGQRLSDVIREHGLTGNVVVAAGLAGPGKPHSNVLFDVPEQYRQLGAAGGTRSFDLLPDQVAAPRQQTPPQDNRQSSLSAPPQPGDATYVAYQQSTKAVEQLNASMNVPRTEATEKLVVAAATVAVQQNLRVDEVALNKPTAAQPGGTTAFVIEKNGIPETDRVGTVPMQQAMQKPLDEAYRLLAAAVQPQTPAQTPQQSQSQERQEQQQAVPRIV